MKTMTRIFLTLIGCFALALFSSCKNNQNIQESSPYIIKGDTVFMDMDNILADKIKVCPVIQNTIAKEIITAGNIQAIPTQFAYIAPPFSGRVTKSYVQLGQNVAVHTPLFEIASPDFTIVQKEYYQSQAERELAQKELKRKEDLIKNGVGSQKEYEEAEHALKLAEKEYENARAALKIYHVNADDMILGQSLIVRAPISGNIIENNIITGQYLNSDADPVALIADLDKVWVTAQVKEKDIRFIQEGDEIHIHVMALPDEVISGKVFHIEEAVDEDTRSIRVLSVCDNKMGKLKIGMYATVHFTCTAENFIEVPEKALLQGENDSYVYVQVNSKTFVKKPVEVNFTKDNKGYIRRGLELNDIIVSEGGYYFK